MINFSKIDNKSLIGKLIRLPLKLIPKGTELPIFQGENKGYKWIAGSGVHGYYFGSYETCKQQAILRFCKKGFIAYDIGAHVGFYTLLFSKLVGKNGIVYSFEPNPRNLYFLEKHLRLNNIDNVKIIPTALGRKRQYTFFDPTIDSSMGRITEKESSYIISVDAIDRLIFEEKLIFPPNIMKIDVEGTEMEVLEGMVETVRRFRPIIFVAIDKYENRNLIYQFLKGLRFKIEAIRRMPNEIFAVPI